MALAWDNSNGPHHGRLYAVFVDMAASLNSGPDQPTLFQRLRTGPPQVGTHRVGNADSASEHVSPSIAVDSLTAPWRWDGGTRLVGVTSAAADFFVAASTDGGELFSNGNGSASNLPTPRIRSLPASLIRGYEMPLEWPSLTAGSSDLGRQWHIAMENAYPAQFEVATTILGVIDVELPPLALKPIPIQAVKGQLFDGTVATFTGSGPGLMAGNFTATIQWGDGSESAGLVTQSDGPGTPFQVSGSHTYTETGGYPLWVRVHDNANNRDTDAVSNITAQQGSQNQPTIAIDRHLDRVFAAGNHVNLQLAGHSRGDQPGWRRDLGVRHVGGRQRWISPARRGSSRI